MKWCKGLLFKGFVLLLIVSAAVFLLVRFGGTKIFGGYDASAPTPAKFARMVKWIPGGSEFELTLDLHRAAADPFIREKILALSGGTSGKGGVASEFVAAVANRQNLVGMLMLVGRLGNPGEQPIIAVITQGDFDEQKMIPLIRSALSAGQAGLTSERVGGHTLYLESNERDPFGFLILDPLHIAIGTRSSLTALYEQEPPAEVRLFGPADAMLFGHLRFGPRLIAMMPEGLRPIQAIDFKSEDGKMLMARIPSGTTPARDLKMFLEGVRSLFMLQAEDNASLDTLLKGIEIGGDEKEVTIKCDIRRMVELFIR